MSRKPDRVVNLELSANLESLLLFLETCEVDHAGRVDVRRMNNEDMASAEHWAKTKFIRWGRVCSQDLFVPEGPDACGTRASASRPCWVQLSERAWKEAYRLRRERARRMWRNRNWQTTAEATALPKDKEPA